MTGYQSKKAAALDEEGMYLVHQTAQPAQQEPFAYWFTDTGRDATSRGWFVRCPCDGKLDGKDGLALFTSPPPQRPWVGLTDDEIQELRKNFATLPAIAAIEAKLKEKNNGT